MRLIRRHFWIPLSAAVFLLVFFNVFGTFFSRQPAVNPNPRLKAHLYQTLEGHSMVVWEVAFSSDGQYLASCSADRTVKLWNWREGVLLRTLTHPEGITSIAFSLDGQWLASGSYDQTVKVWRVQDGALMRTLTGHTGTVWSVAFSPDGRTLASGSADRSLALARSAASRSAGST